MTDFYSRNDVNYNGDVYSIPFPYIKEKEVQVFLDDTLFEDWFFLNDSQIKLRNIPQEVTSNTIVSVRRVTDIDKKVVTYTNNTLLNKENLNLSQDQLLYAVQEIYDNNVQNNIDIRAEVDEKVERVSDAVEQLEALNDAVETAVNASLVAEEKVNVVIQKETEISQTIEQATEDINKVSQDSLDSINQQAAIEKAEIDELSEDLKDSIKDLKVLTTLEIGDIGFTQMAIDESKGKRRILNGQLIIQDQYVEFTNIVKNSVALNPDLACTESEWQTELTMSANGVCYKYVIDDEAGTIRLPKYPDYLDLSINTGAKSQTVSVYGNGKTLGFNDGSQNFGLVGSFATNTRFALASPSVYGKNVGTTMTSNNYLSKQMKSIGIVTSASNSGLTGNVTVPAVESEKIKGTYFIQVATGAETKDEIINEHELVNPYVLLEPKFFETPIYNLSWLATGGFNGSKAVHPSAYDALLIELNEEIEVGTTQNNYTKRGLSVKLATESYSDYDFVVDTANETFRCPLKVKLASGKAVVGNGMALGLTNGITNYGLSETSQSGLGGYTTIYGQSVGLKNGGEGLLGNLSVGITTDATKSGIETSDNELYLYFYVGEVAQNTNLINAGRIEEIKANKSDVDGQWVAVYHTIFSDQIFSTATFYEYDLSTILPNDGFNYECIIAGYGRTGNTSGNSIGLGVKSSILTNRIIIGRTQTRTSSSSSFAGNVNIPIGSDRKVWVEVTDLAGTSGGCGLYVFGYRRLGTNS